MLKIVVAVILPVLLACCSDSWGYEDVALVPQSGRVSWPDDVRRAADVWNDALEVACERRIFHVTEVRIADADEHPIQLIPAERWDRPGLGGYIEDQKIRVRDGYDRDVEQMILVHELGHALGLEHVNDRPSIMNRSGGPFTPEDVAEVADLAGCNLESL